MRQLGDGLRQGFDVLAHLLVTEGFSTVEDVAFVPLDGRGAREMAHADIAKLVLTEITAVARKLGDGSKSSNPEWWAQGVAVPIE